MRRPGLVVLALAAIAAGCDAEASDRPSRHDCEAVLAHLIVLEQPAVDPWGAPVETLCKYHPSCDGSERKRFMAMCPRVLSRRELRCYQRATSLAHADQCLPRAELDRRVQTGEGDTGGRGYGAGPAWLGFDTRSAWGTATGISECDEYMAVLDRYVRCNEIPPSVTDGLEDQARQMAETWRRIVDPEERRLAADTCREGRQSLIDIAASMGCRL
jgi:hypothetical protein